jgi:hypothetical protein
MKALLTALALVCTAPAFAQSSAQPQPPANASPGAPQQNRSAASGATAPAREDPAAARRLFRELDRNRDGYLTDDELWSERGRQGNWAAVDRNRDGRIGPDEFTAVPSAR